nr:DNA directed RNA polymerase subunit 2 [Mimivirus sp.]
MMLGDGHWMKNGTMRYDTSSLKLANDFQRLCLHAGWSTNMTIKSKKGYTTYIEGRKVVSTTDAYRLTIITKQNNPKVNKTAQQDKWIDYDDNVYCCTVSSGVIYVRRNGIPVFSGNSRAGSFEPESMQTHWLVHETVGDITKFGESRSSYQYQTSKEI